jgi:L-threonylcarbamoyladenylate synthase
MKKIRFNREGYREALIEASEIIAAGGIVCFPTETFYGLGVRFDNLPALRRLYEIKKRPREKAMPLIIGDMSGLAAITDHIDDATRKIGTKLWPGPLTLLIPAKRGLSEFITAGTGQVAVRVPGPSFAYDLAKHLQFPITATSANISGMPAADNPDDVLRYFGDLPDLLVDGGKTGGNKPSTIIRIEGGKVLVVRQGAVSEEDILRALGPA